MAGRNWGASDSKTLELIQSLALEMQISGQSLEAEKLFRQGYFHSQSLSSDDPQKSRAISSLVICLNREMRYEESKVLLESGILELQSATGDHSNAIRKVQTLLSKTIELMGSISELVLDPPKSESFDKKL